MTTANLRALHDKAMDVAERAQIAKNHGESEKSLALFQDAFKKEKKAAEAAIEENLGEPTRSILLRSAASLALDCDEHREAERLIATALAGSPPAELAEELRDLLEQVYFNRHLSLRGVALESTEIQLSIAGRGVGFGMALSDEIVGRVQIFEKLVHRTAERKLQFPYRDQGNAPRPVREGYNVLISVPRAASFAVSLKVGKPNAQPMLGAEPQNILDDIVENLGLLNDRKEDVLRKKISSEAYLRNFIGLARMFAPSGEDVNLVGLTIIRNGVEERLQLTRTGTEILFPNSNSNGSGAKKIRVTGKLLFADSTHGKDRIKLIETNKTQHTIIVPEGMMADIVRPLWDSVVSVQGVDAGEGIVLERIEKGNQAP